MFFLSSHCPLAAVSFLNCVLLTLPTSVSGQDKIEGKSPASPSPISAIENGLENATKHLVGKVKLEKPGQTILFDLGKSKPNEIVKFSATIESDFPTPLKLRTQAGCKCVSGLPPLIEISRTEPQKIEFQLKLPSRPEKFGSSIRCYDSEIELSFTIAFTGEAIHPVLSEPKIIQSREKNADAFSMKLSPAFEGIGIRLESISMEEGNVEIVSSKCSENGIELQFAISSPRDPNLLESNLIIRCTDANGVEIVPLKVPVKFYERIGMRPQTAIFQRTGSESWEAVWAQNPFTLERIPCVPAP